MSAYVEDGGEMERWGGFGGGDSVLGSLWVSQVLSGRESGRYLIVIASMERTEAGPVRKFLIYLVFLFSLLFLPSPTASLCGVEWGVGGSQCAPLRGQMEETGSMDDRGERGPPHRPPLPSFPSVP